MVIFVAEFTTNHMGNLNLLLKMVEKAKYAGVDYIKMQKKNLIQNMKVHMEILTENIGIYLNLIKNSLIYLIENVKTLELNGLLHFKMNHHLNFYYNTI
jgi:sialic acid synthase SpsE